MSESTHPASPAYRNGLILALILLIAFGFIALVRYFIIALVMAFIFSALLNPFYRRALKICRGKKALASILVLLVSSVVVGAPLLGMLTLVANETVQMSEEIGPWLKQHVQGDGMTQLPSWLPVREELMPFQNDILQKVGEWTGDLTTFLVDSLKNATQGAAVFVLNLFVMLYAMFFFLMHGEAIGRKFIEYLPLDADTSRDILDRGLAVTKASLKSILVIGVIQGVLVGGAFWIAGIEGAAFWGALVMVLSAIPGIGPPLVWLPASIYLMMNGQTVAGVLLAIWGFAVVSTIDNILRPRIVGKETRLPDLLILISSLGGITLFGPAGIIIGPVIASVFVTAMGVYKEVFLGKPKDGAEAEPEAA